MHPCFNHGEFTSEANVDQEMKDQAIQWARVMYATKRRPATVAAAVGAAAAVAVQDGPPEEPAKKKAAGSGPSRPHGVARRGSTSSHWATAATTCV